MGKKKYCKAAHRQIGNIDLEMLLSYLVLFVLWSLIGLLFQILKTTQLSSIMIPN